MEPSIRFCRSADGTQLAYAVIGSGAPFVHVPGFTTNIEIEWEDPEARSWTERIAARRQVIRCQRRGIGASQSDNANVSLQVQIDDLAAVIDQADAEKVAIFAAYDAAPSALAYTAANPQRVAHLVLWAPYIVDRDAGPFDALAGLARQNWRLFLRTWADLCFPSGPIERRRWYSDMVRQSTSADVVARYIEFMRDVDVSDVLAGVRTPALVLHRSGDRYVPPSSGRKMAAALGAEFVPLEGDIGLPVLGDSTYLKRMFEFLGGDVANPGEASAGASHGGFRTILFTDLAGHTEMMRRLGDERGRDVLREHERIMREILKEFGGAEVKTMGDGFMASFASVTRAMDCAIALQRAFAAHEGEPLHVRVGLNAGEPIEEDGDLFGATVIMASRVAAAARADEILIPEPLRHLLAGKSYVYSDRGEVMLKGFEDAVRLYEVRWRE
jgi:class 3 adenylate cyclase/pimeloyl-ACP methyl ester carboxylesterase